jgi:hypothetical protein
VQVVLEPGFSGPERFVISRFGTLFKRNGDHTRYELIVAVYVNWLMLLRQCITIALWEACYEAMERGCILTMDDRSAIAKGNCAVIVTLPEEQQKMCLDKMLSLTVARMERLRTNAQQSTGDVQKLAIGFLADEVAVLTCTASFLAEAPLKAEDAMESGCDTSSDPRLPLPDFFLQHVKAVWYHFIELATLWGDHKVSTRTIKKQRSTD